MNLNPYDNNTAGRATAPETVNLSNSPDPFGESLTILGQRFNALQKVKLMREGLAEARNRANRGIASAEQALREAEREAEALGAYSMVPPNLRPGVAS